jgi:hypothetical protein
MALPNVIWPWSIFYSKDQLLRKGNKESLGVFFFWNWIFKINLFFGKHVPNLPRYYSIWNVWNLNLKKLKCLNFNARILKVENWNLWKLKTWHLQHELYDIDEILELVHEVFHYPIHIFDQIHLSKFVKVCEDDNHVETAWKIFLCWRQWSATSNEAPNQSLLKA